MFCGVAKAILQKRCLPIIPTVFHTTNRLYSSSSFSDDENEDDLEKAHLRWQSEQQDMEMHNNLLQQYNLRALDSQHLLVIQPYYHHSHVLARRNTNEDLMMAETLGLVKTLDWKVVDALTIGLKTVHTKSFFGTGKIAELKGHISQLESKTSFVTGIFVSTYKLTSSQRFHIEEVLDKPVLDRYNVILQIFQRHARTKEAKLQVKLAELPYLKQRLLGDHDVERDSKHSKHRMGENWFDQQRMVLARREKKIKMALGKIKEQRSLMRKNRERLHWPTVAVVGYTNCGKTSLIKAVTGTHKLEPKDHLFATLDVTVHPTVLPSQLNTLMIDTVGFISDIPTDLIASFNATLEDAAMADLLIHVRDVSNPDHVQQNEKVLATLANLNVEQKVLDSMITVGNKVDLIPPEDWKSIEEDGMIPISCVEGRGLESLMQQVDSFLIESTGRRQVTLRVPTGSKEYFYLRQNVAVSSIDIDEEDQNYSLVHALLLNLELKQFEKRFGAAVIC